MSEHKKLARLAARVVYAQTHALERREAAALKAAEAKAMATSLPNHHHRNVSALSKVDVVPDGLVEIVVDALTRRQWTREDDLAHALKLNPKQLRRVLRHLEHRLKVLRRSHVKERQTLKEQRLVMERGVTEEEAATAVEKRTASWCCLDYARIVDTLRFGIKGVKSELERMIDGGTFEESYACKNKEACGKRFSALDAARVFDARRGGFVCDSCGTDVVRAGEENEEENDGDDANASSSATNNGIAKESKQALKLKLKKFSDQIAGVERQIAKCLRYPAPSFGTLQEYVIAKKRTKEAREAAATGQPGGQGYWGSIGVARGTQAFEQRLEETTFEIQIGGENGENGEKSNQGIDGQEKKEMPEWITRELQVDEEGKETKIRKIEGAGADAQKSGEMTDVDAVQEQYAKALLAALQAQQKDTTDQAKAIAVDEKEAAPRDVEMKSAAKEATPKGGAEEEEEEEEWEEA